MSIQIGVDYYPEQWPEQMWEQDADRMKECGVKVVRMAEFAWSRMEPEEVFTILNGWIALCPFLRTDGCR